VRLGRKRQLVDQRILPADAVPVGGAVGRIEELVDGRLPGRRRGLEAVGAGDDGQDGGQTGLVDVIGQRMAGTARIFGAALLASHDAGVMVTGIVQIDMDSFLCGMRCFYRLEQGNQAHCVDLCHLQHLCLAGLKVDGTMNVQALAPGRLFDRDRSILRRPTSRGRYLMRGMDGINEHHRLVRSHGVGKLLVACDEGLLPDLIEAAWHLVRLAVVEAEAMQ
jgi:hypothetical protein